jgi:hypothetical protein
MTEPVVEEFKTGYEDMDGYGQIDFEHVAKHAEGLGFKVERGDLVTGVTTLDSRGKPANKKPAILALYLGGILELFRHPEDNEMNGKRIIMAGLVQREFKDEYASVINKAVTAAKAEADEILKEFATTRQQLLEHLNSGNKGITMEVVADLPDYAGYWLGDTELLCVWVVGRDRYSALPMAPKRKTVEYDSLPKLKAAAKRITNKFLKDQKK